MEEFECERGHPVTLSSAEIATAPDGGLHLRCQEPDEDSDVEGAICGARLRVVVSW